MKVKPSHQRGQVVFDVGARDVALLAEVNRGPDIISTAVEEDEFRRSLRDRLTRRTGILDEILSRSRTLADIRRAEMNRSGAAPGASDVMRFDI